MISLFVDTCTSNLIIAVSKNKEIIKKFIQKNDNKVKKTTFYYNSIISISPKESKGVVGSTCTASLRSLFSLNLKIKPIV